MSRKLLLFYVLATVYAVPEVQLPKGLIRGREDRTINNKTYYAFEKIPYAAPPVGQLRFKAPVPPPSWEEPLDTLSLDVSCYQELNNWDSETEDCLYLNVFTPELPSQDSKSSLPVMLYIFGGGFVAGTAAGLRSDRLIEEDVILVVINYRLGPFGFISTQDAVIPGNNGLKDQQLAIQWVHENINLFGGDPELITIFGQSAGAASVSYQLLNQKLKGVIRGAILQSGTSLNSMAFQRRSREIAFGTAALLNETFKNSNDSTTLLEYLMNVDAKDLDTASEKYHELEISAKSTEILQGMFWAPVVEVKNPDAFLTRKMYGLLQAGSTIGVPIMMGMTSEECVGHDRTFFGSLMAAFDEHLDWLVPDNMQITDEADLLEMGRSIREMYTGGEPLSDHLGDGIRYCTDSSMARPSITHAKLYSKNYKTYFYQFSYDGEIGGVDAQYDGAGTVGHSEDLKYIFCSGTACDVSNYPESDQITVQRMIRMWTNFAKYQNPTPEPQDLLQNLTWPLLSTEDGDFLYVDINENLEIKNHPKNNTYDRWIQLYNSLDFNDFDTY